MLSSTQCAPAVNQYNPWDRTRFARVDQRMPESLMMPARCTTLSIFVFTPGAAVAWQFRRRCWERFLTCCACLTAAVALLPLLHDLLVHGLLATVPHQHHPTASTMHRGTTLSVGDRVAHSSHAFPSQILQTLTVHCVRQVATFSTPHGCPGRPGSSGQVGP
jgi:hypothetical protein